jgi:hypothetical protein
MLAGRLLRIIGQICVGLFLSLAVNANDGETAAGHIPLPVLPKAKASYSATQGCVEPTEQMRRLHPSWLDHQRDNTVHLGIRTKKHSLAECINCHVIPNEEGKYVNIQKDPQHFCRSCHTYVAVNPGCFECHSSVPETVANEDAGAGKQGKAEGESSMTVSVDNPVISNTSSTPSTVQ